PSPSIPFFFSLPPPPPFSTLFPYTTLFRSLYRSAAGRCLCGVRPTLWRADPGSGLLGARATQVLRDPRSARLPDRRRSPAGRFLDRKSTRLNSSHGTISYAVFCLKKKKKQT